MIKFNLMNSVRNFCKTGILKVPCIVALSTERAKKEQYVPSTCVNFSSGKCLSHERILSSLETLLHDMIMSY
jgi:hypothetical protein